MGISLEHFDENVPQEFLCVLCRKVLLHPLVTDCQHILCTKCFRKRIKKRLSCSVCGKSMGTGNNVDPGWKRRYERLKVNCTKGCEKLIILGDLQSHLNDYCPLSFTSCTNAGCTKKVRRRELPNHLSQCEYRTVECDSCGHRTCSVNLRMHQIVQKCTRRKNRHMIVQNRREMDARVKEHRLHLQGESFRRELEERDLEKVKMWTAIARNNPSRPVSGSPSLSRSKVVDKEDRASSLTPSRQTTVGRWKFPRTGTATHQNLPDTAKLCVHCNKLFLEETNHDEVCRWHEGPIVDVFGGMCQTCGKLDNLEGCVRGFHVAVPQDFHGSRSARQSPGISAFLT